MTARTHDLAAITALLAVVMVRPIETITLGTVIAALIANQLGGIAPDIDQPTAPFWRNLPIGGVVGRWIGRLLGGHRFLTHSLVGLVLFGVASNMFLALIHPIMPTINTDYVWWAFMIGMVSHLIMDTFTKEGVPWLLPIPLKFGFPPLKAFRVTAGKKFEALVVFPGLLAVAIWLCAANYHALLMLLHWRIVER